MRLEANRLSRPFAFVVFELFGEAIEPIGERPPKDVGKPARPFPATVAQMPRAGQAMIAAGDGAPGDDGLRVTVDRMHLLEMLDECPRVLERDRAFIFDLGVSVRVVDDCSRFRFPITTTPVAA